MEATPKRGQHGYRVTPERFCADCKKDCSEGCPCCAPSESLGVLRCRACWHKHLFSGEHERARERLNEAAPALLRALEKALRESGCDGDLCMHDWHDDARAALATARGETP